MNDGMGINPSRSLFSRPASSVVFSSRALRIVCPFLPSFKVKMIFVQIVKPFFEDFSSLVIGRVKFGLLAFPSVLIVRIFSNIRRRSAFVIQQSAGLAGIRNSVAFFVVFGTGFINAAHGAYLTNKWGFSGLHNRDIIDHVLGDVKLGENGENPDRTIPCQAAAFKRAAEGVTTRDRAKAVISPRAPSPEQSGDEIVCSAWEHAGAEDKEPRTLTFRTTIESRTKSAQDNLTNNNALLLKLQERGNVKTISGGSTILQELYYNDPNTNFASSYSGYETINISPDSPISAAQFTLKHYADAVTISGPEMLQNSGKEQMIELLATRVEIAESRLRNKIDLDLHGDGTGNAGKNLVGLAAMISTTPSTGTYGGIDRATWTFWQNGAYTSTGLAGTAATASNIQQSMNTVALSRVRGTDHIDLIYAGSTAYSLYLNSLQAIQRITDDKLGAAGFSALKFYGGAGTADVVLGGGIGGNQTATRMDFINTRYVHFRPHKDRNFVPIGGDRQAVNQDAVVRLMGWSGALTCSGAQFNATFSTT